MAQRTYLAIDLKSYYASAECAARHLDPLTTNLRSYNNRISVTEYYRITFGIKICDYRTRFIVFIR